MSCVKIDPIQDARLSNCMTDGFHPGLSTIVQLTGVVRVDRDDIPDDHFEPPTVRCGKGPPRRSARTITGRHLAEKVLECT